MIRIGVILCIALSCAFLAPRRALEQDLVLTDQQRLHGHVVGNTLLIPANSTVVADGDLEFEITGEVRIEGRLIAADRDLAASQLDGIDIRVRSSDMIAIWNGGSIQGGLGRAAASPDSIESFAAKGLAGGRGSDIVLEAPLIIMDGTVRGGDAGPSGANRLGARGGSVDLFGIALSPAWRDGITLRGGTGGTVAPSLRGAEDPGMGGAGGDAIVHDPRAGDPNVTHHEVSARYQAFLSSHVGGSATNPGLGGGSYASLAECPAGTAGAAGAIAGGGQGQAGPPGAAGTMTSPAGQTGGTGGLGGVGMGGAGEAGKPGSDCCASATGGAGGAGGMGGNATGGQGGMGGQGGAGYWDTTLNPPAYTGPGGDGGSGGSGGDGKAGKPGAGGKGGRPGGAGGAGGGASTGSDGVGGAGGHGGRGVIQGSTGPTGGPGGHESWSAGSSGAMGEDC